LEHRRSNIHQPTRVLHGAGFCLILLATALACNASRTQAIPTATSPAPQYIAVGYSTQLAAPALPTVSPATATTAATSTAEASATALPTSAPETALQVESTCLQPPDDYTPTQVSGETISNRTLWMLRRAQELYGGPGDLLHITQGSYRNDIGASFGTHAGGGAVDLSIRDPLKNTFMFGETEAMVHALRLAGFAAWYRGPSAVGLGSAPHIHAIAVGDKELSPEAQKQVVGDEGYFKGMDGLIPPYGPSPDPHGGPILCSWMQT
jgi:hypothetical protein